MEIGTTQIDIYKYSPFSIPGQPKGQNRTYDTLSNPTLSSAYSPYYWG
jgi:hypothetical protein